MLAAGFLSYSFSETISYSDSKLDIYLSCDASINTIAGFIYQLEPIEYNSELSEEELTTLNN